MSVSLWCGQTFSALAPLLVMRGLVPRIHVFFRPKITWMAGTSPAMGGRPRRSARGGSSESGDGVGSEVEVRWSAAREVGDEAAGGRGLREADVPVAKGVEHARVASRRGRKRVV